MVFLLALEGGDGTVLGQSYHLIQGQRRLPHNAHREHAEDCQPNKEAYTYSNLHIHTHLNL